MTRYIVRRLLLTIPSIWAISLAVFLIVRLVPGDPARTILGPRATEESLAEVRAVLGLDQPIHVQYIRWMGKLLVGDMGRSIISGKTVVQEIFPRFMATLELSMMGMFFTLLLGIPAGVMAAIRRNSLLDHINMVLSVLGMSMPVFWLGLLMIYVFAYSLGLLPFSGRIDVTLEFRTLTGLYTLDSLLYGDFSAFRSALAHLILPALALASVQGALIARISRSSMLEVLGEDYVRTARAKGLKERLVVYRHAFRNALIPLTTLTGLQVGTLLGGAILTETVFAWPGLGRLTVHAIFDRDYPIIQGAVLLFALLFLLSNLVVDILYAVLDPRVTYD